MDRKDKEPKGGTATASKTAANRKQTGGESSWPDQGATTSQNQGGTQNQGAAGSSQQNQSSAGASQQTQGGGQPQNQATQNQGTQNSGGGQDLLQQAKQTTNEVVSQVQQQATSQLNQQ